MLFITDHTVTNKDIAGVDCRESRDVSAEVRIIGVIAEQTKVILVAKRSHGPIIRLSSCDHEHER